MGPTGSIVAGLGGFKQERANVIMGSDKRSPCRRFLPCPMHGNPWFRLLRHEVEALVTEKSGQDHLHMKKLQKELADINKEARKLKTRLAAIERRRAELMKELDG